MDEPKITAAHIHHNNIAGFPTNSEVIATFDNGETKTVITYYADEIQFHPLDVFGMTEAEARELHRKRDMEYLRS